METAQHDQTGNDPNQPKRELTHLEQQTISLAIHGKSRKYVAEVLGINGNALDQRMRSIFLKLPINTNGELINWARDHGGHDLKGNLHGVYLFEGSTLKLPWPTPPKKDDDTGEGDGPKG